MNSHNSKCNKECSWCGKETKKMGKTYYFCHFYNAKLVHIEDDCVHEEEIDRINHNIRNVINGVLELRDKGGV